MRKICFAALLLIFPAAPLWAEGKAVPEPAAAETPVPLDDFGQSAEPILLAADSETSRVTTFTYRRRTAEDDKAASKAAGSRASDQNEPQQLQRGRSRPKVATYGYNPGSASAAEASGTKTKSAADSRPVKRGLSEPKVTTFDYKRPASAQTAGEAVKKPKAEPTPAPKAESRPAPRPADVEPPAPPKDKVKFTTLNPRTEELEMAKPEAASNRGRAARVRAARKKAETPPPLPTPAYDGSTSFNVAGVYVNCPKNKEENCGPASEEFKNAFPVDQTAPYVMIRKDGRGYLAPDEKRTIAFTWQFLGDNALLIIMEDSKHRKVEYRAEGRYLRNMSTGDLFYMSLTDAEWNVAPEPYSKIRARKEKKK